VATKRRAPGKRPASKVLRRGLAPDEVPAAMAALPESPKSRHRRNYRLAANGELYLRAQPQVVVRRKGGYNAGGMDEAAKAIMQVAARYGLPKHVLEAIGALVKGAARETTAQSNDDTRLGRLEARFAARLSKLDLPEGGFTNEKDAAAAKRLATTTRELQKVQAALGLPVIETPERVKKGDAMAASYFRHHDAETGEPLPSRPRGRPRRVSVQEGLPAI
jgi:hypothetical protein